MRELHESCQDGRIKLYLIFRVLNYRREHRELFDQGDYLPLEAKGARSRHLCAFARRVNGQGVIAVAPRLIATLVPEPEIPPLGERTWLDTFLPLPEDAGARFRNIINDEELVAVEREGRQGLPLAQLFAGAPVALLEAL